MMNLDEAFLNEVVSPWNKLSRGFERPWEAHERVLDKWSEGLCSSDPLRRFVSAVGTFRCVNGHDLHFEGTRALAETADIVGIDVLTLIDLLLCGATLPEEFLLALFTAELPRPSSRLLGLYCRFLRHPGGSAEKSTLPDPLGFFAALNPKTAFDGMDDYGDWGAGVRNFRSRTPNPKPTEAMEIIGTLLRCDVGPGEIRRLIAHETFPAQCIPVFIDHPVLSANAAPVFQPENPSLAAISYFYRPDPVCSLWRYWNPLLCSPWLLDSVSPCEDAGLLCAAGILGAPVSLMNLPKGAADSDLLRRLLNTHPSMILVGYLLADECNPEKLMGSFLHQ